MICLMNRPDIVQVGVSDAKTPYAHGMFETLNKAMATQFPSLTVAWRLHSSWNLQKQMRL